MALGGRGAAGSPSAALDRDEQQEFVSPGDPGIIDPVQEGAVAHDAEYLTALYARERTPRPGVCGGDLCQHCAQGKALGRHVDLDRAPPEGRAESSAYLNLHRSAFEVIVLPDQRADS
jgi:hypothetical protein